MNNMSGKPVKLRYKYIFGPVPSRRLGRSLGVDIIPMKTCSQNCLYCQLGKNCTQTIQRKEYVPIELVINEIRSFVDSGGDADYITISGSGEPTLNSRVGELIRAIKKFTDIPVAVITNSTLLSDPDVREQIVLADVVLPSLDGPDEQTFQKINHPFKDIKFDEIVEGLCKFRGQYQGQIWLEIFLIDGINTSDRQIEKLRTLVEKISPDKIHLNTAVRPTADRRVKAVPQQRMNAIASMIPGAEVVADYSADKSNLKNTLSAQQVLDMLKRRPCSFEDICAGLAADKNDVRKIIDTLIDQKAVMHQVRGDTDYFVVNS